MTRWRSRAPCAWRQPVAAAAIALAAALSACAGTAAAQDGIGRLFFTPGQRAQLDESRRRPLAQQPARDLSGAPAPAQSRLLSVDGIVRRNDGQATVWLNRTPTAAPQASGAVRIGPVRDAADGADLRLPDNDRRIRLKVGQEVDLQSGQVQERYRQPVPPAAPPSAPDAGARGDAAKPAASGTAGKAEGEPVPAARGDTPPAPARDAAVERMLRELGRRLDEPPREPVRPGDPAP